MSSLQLMTLRIRKQTKQILTNPLDNLIISIKNQRQIHFCIYNLQHPYQGGFYHGVLQLPQNYPFSAPKFKFITNNGRFQAGKYVCTTFTSYHQQAWSSSWTIRTILTAIVSFFLSQQTGFGTLQQTSQKRSLLARKSLGSNLQDQEFCELFKEKLQQLGVSHEKLDIKKEQTKQIRMIQINQILSGQISKQNIQSVMLGDNNIVRNVNNSNRLIRLLYVVLLILILVIVLRSF